jgi:hypothetical protein
MVFNNDYSHLSEHELEISKTMSVMKRHCASLLDKISRLIAHVMIK